MTANNTRWERHWRRRKLFNICFWCYDEFPVGELQN